VLVSDFDFDLPEHLIGQQARPRGRSRVLLVSRREGTFREITMDDLPALFAPGDCIVGNDTRVFPARLIGRRDPSGGAAECLLLERLEGDRWQALVHPGQKLKPGARLLFEDVRRAPGVRVSATVHDRLFFGRRIVSLEAEGAETVDEAVDRLGHVPLPPYIHRDDSDEDRARYQTVFARRRGSVAAPTAGLHFTDENIERLRAAGVAWTTITHHVGYGTFKPVRVDRVEDHTVDAERYEIGSDAAAAVAAARQAGGRVVAVGTTTTRALESAAADGRTVAPGRATTDLFIYPGYPNFHLPKSSLLMLVAAFAGRELILDAYRHAVADGFHFYSYGDMMVVV
jgi:S-adenosylmethionine:tRNA ribosyltransferase-isomerase